MRVAKGSVVRSLRDHRVHLENTYTGEKGGGAGGVVGRCDVRGPERFVWRARRRTLVRAGDAVAPRTAYEAILEGRRAAYALEELP